MDTHGKARTSTSVPSLLLPVLDDQQNVRPIKELLQSLYMSLCSLVQDMGKSVLVGNINIWVHRMENILQWQQQLDNIQINRVRTLRVAGSIFSSEKTTAPFSLIKKKVVKDNFECRIEG